MDPSLKAFHLRRLGTRLDGKFRLDRLLGVGGMGAVFAASAPDGRPVAVKSLHKELSRMPAIQERLFREMYVGNTIAHSGVARIFEHGTDQEGCGYIVMELLEGETLEALWEAREHRLPVGLVLAITERILDVLVAAHAIGIVHRDIKPDNVFMTASGELKILDFGIARLVDMRSATASGELLGTPAFMPPEQAGGYSKTADERSDIWSLGALMFTMISGRHVHDAPNHALQLIYAATHRALSLSSIVPDVPQGVVEVVDRALEFDRSARWPSAQAMLASVRALAVEPAAPMSLAVPTVRHVSEPPNAPVARRSPSIPAGPTLPLGEMKIASKAGRDEGVG